MIRLFAGLELPAPVKMALGMLRGGVDGAKWQRDDQLHLTIRFIGEVAPRDAEDIHEALYGVGFLPFEVALRGVGLFGKAKQPRALWAGVADPAPLKHLHEKIDHALDRAGRPPEDRKYKPHVTLARFRGGRSSRLEPYLVEHQDFAAPPFRVEHFTLFRSHLGSDGARYLVEERFSALGAEPVEDAFDSPHIGAAEQPHMYE